MKRVVKIFCLTLLLLILIVVNVLAWALGTQSGFQQVLSLANRFAPGNLEWQEATGKLGGRIQIKDLHYIDADSIEASISALDFEWTPGALLSRRVDVEQLHLSGIEVHLGESDTAPETEKTEFELPEISLPVSVNLKDIAINDVSVYPAGQSEPIIIDQVELAVSAAQTEVQLTKLSIAAPQGEVHMSGQLNTSGDYPMDLSANWQTDVDPTKPLQGEGTFKGSLANLQISHAITGFAEANVEATLLDIVQAPSWDASIQASIPEPQSVSALLTAPPTIQIETS